MKWKNRIVKRVVLITLIVILLVVFIVSSAVFLHNVLRSAKERKTNEELQDIVREARRDLETAEITDTNDTSNPGDSGPNEKNKKQPEVIADSGVLYEYDTLWQRNHDMAGWIEIPGTGIAYPVMFTPDYPEKYLRMAFDGSWAISGSLFLGEGWDPEGHYSIIFGHHMNDGSMFGKLMDYYSDRSTAGSYGVVKFDTLYDKREYDVVTAFYSKTDSDEKGYFRGYYVRSLPYEDTFEQYMEEVRSAAIWEPLTDVRWGDDLLLLSTCSSYYDTTERFIVVARYRPD